MTMPENETYLGDGLYASHDGFQIQLRAPGPNGDSEVYLEPAVMDALIKYAQKIGMVKP